MRRALVATITAAGAVAGLAGAAAPATAAPAPTGTRAEGATSRLALTVAPVGGGARSVWLSCHPVRGSHPRAAAACAELATAGGDPARMPGEDRVCLQVYAPVTALATGRWRGRSVRYRQTFGNDCVMDVATGAVFRF